MALVVIKDDVELDAEGWHDLLGRALSEMEHLRLETAASAAALASNEDVDSQVLITRGLIFHAEGGACFISSCS